MQARSRFSTPLKKRRYCEITSLYINKINILQNSPPSPKTYASSKYNPLSISPSLPSSKNGAAALKKIFDGTVMSKQSSISSTCHNKSLTCTPEKNICPLLLLRYTIDEKDEYDASIDALVVCFRHKIIISYHETRLRGMKIIIFTYTLLYFKQHS